MAVCDVCGSKMGIWDSYRLADGKCCPNCKKLANSHKNMVSDVKTRIANIENKRYIIDKLLSFFEFEYKRFDLEFRYDDSKGADIKNAVRIGFAGSEYLTYHNNTLYFIQGWDDYFIKHIEAKFISNVFADKNVEFEPLGIRAILYENIEFYYKEGDIQYTSDVTGGGGLSLTGAIIGGIVAGGVGAIIGSCKSIDPIRTKVSTHNATKTVLVYKDGDERVSEEYERHELYNYLLLKIPEKDLKTVQLSLANSNHTKNNSGASAADEIRKFKGLLDDGIISQEEFEMKKKQLLELK